MSGFRRTLCAAVGATTLVSVCVAVAATAAAQSPARPYSAAIRSSAPLVQRAAAPANHPPSTRSKGARSRPASGSATSAVVPQITAPSVAPPALGTLRRNFNGVSSRDSEVTNFDLRFEPPDQGLCAGNGFVLEAVNSAYTIYTQDGRVVRGPFNINDLFNEGAAEFTSDPRCYFDPATNRWFATIVFLNDAFNRGLEDIAVSTTSDPTGTWRHYRIDTSNLGGRGCPCFGDQPRLGMDQNNLYISTDEFSILGPQFNGGQLYAIAKHDLVVGRSSARFVHFANLTSGGALALAVEPAITTGPADAEYLMNSLDPNHTFDNRLGVWALTHGERVATGGTPTLSQTLIRSEPYGQPPAARQKGSSSRLDSGDDRMQQTQFINGVLWGELTTSVTIRGDSTERAGAAWFAVQPHLRNGQIAGAPIDRQGYVVSRGRYVIYPALQADAAGRAAMVFTLTGSDVFPSAAYTVLPATGTKNGRITVAGAGTGPYDPGQPGGATTRGPCSTRSWTQCGWRRSTSRRCSARPARVPGTGAPG